MADQILGRILYEDRLREAAARESLWRSSRFIKLPRLVQVLIAVLS
jgi:hypothetical protein